MHPRLPLLCLVLAAIFTLPAAAKIEVRATVSPNRIGLGEVAVLTVEVTNDSLSSIRFSPHFELDNFELAGAVQQMSDLRYGSAGLSRTFRVVWPLRAIHVGTAAVRKIALEVNGTLLPLTDREVQVQRQPTQPPPEAQGPDEDPFGQFFGRIMEPLRRLREPRQPALFLRQEVEPAEGVVGQQLTYSIYLYARRDVDVASLSELPKFKGFWVREIPQPQRLRADFTQIEGDTYSRVLVLRRALFPIRPGHYPIEPASFDFAVREMASGLFDPAIENSRPIHLVAPAIGVDVQPLPAEPPGFTGAVGNMTLLTSLAPREVRVGGATTLTVTLAGEGNLGSVDDPKLAPPAGVEVSAPQQEGKEDLRGDTVRGQRTWRFSVIPKSPGRFTLEAPQVPYYDPGRHEYRIAAAAPLVLNVLPPEPRRDAEAEDGGQEEAPHPGFRERLRENLPWGIAGLSSLVALSVLLLRRKPSHAGALVAGPAGAAPQLQAAATALRQALEAAASQSRSSAFAQQTEAAWRAFLEAAYALPLGTPSVRWADVLAGQGRNGPIRADLETLLEDLRFLRYAPQLASLDEIRSQVLALNARLVERLARS